MYYLQAHRLLLTCDTYFMRINHSDIDLKRLRGHDDFREHTLQKKGHKQFRQETNKIACDYLGSALRQA
jgi:hypothetical protein